jgi:hypothetical protein
MHRVLPPTNPCQNVRAEGSLLRYEPATNTVTSDRSWLELKGTVTMTARVGVSVNNNPYSTVTSGQPYAKIGLKWMHHGGKDP